MGAFWAKGYESTSLNDLMAATGLHKGSLYQAFGDKHSLFLESLKRYLSQMRQTLGETPALRASQLTIVDIRAYVRAKLSAVEQRGKDEIGAVVKLPDAPKNRLSLPALIAHARERLSAGGHERVTFQLVEDGLSGLRRERAVHEPERLLVLTECSELFDQGPERDGVGGIRQVEKDDPVPAVGCALPRDHGQAIVGVDLDVVDAAGVGLDRVRENRVRRIRDVPDLGPVVVEGADVGVVPAVDPLEHPGVA